jgi:23S rRNA (pseudouridine1915-N3)-methyltransferase
MEIAILAVGRMKAGPESDLFTRYLERSRKAGGKLGLKGFSVHEVPESRAGRAAERLAQEEGALIGRLPPVGRTICLDAAGELIDSEGFAEGLRSDAAAGVPRSVFVIGGADGLGGKALSLADRRLSFGRMTLPHQLVRILVAEQLYRAVTMLSGHPYHRG